jgi:hypothetical protein
MTTQPTAAELASEVRLAVHLAGQARTKAEAQECLARAIAGAEACHAALRDLRPHPTTSAASLRQEVTQLVLEARRVVADFGRAAPVNLSLDLGDTGPIVEKTGQTGFCFD